MAVTSGIDIMASIPAVASVAPDERYNMSHFTYDENNDTYICPQGKIMTTNGNHYQKKKNRHYYTVKHYKTSPGPGCVARALCTKNIKGRLIERSEFAPYIEQNRQNIEARPELYKQRQSIVEHPYGTIKRQWGFYYVITKRGIKRASSDVGFMFIAYNLWRLMNIIDKNAFKKFLQELVFLLSGRWSLPTAIISKINHLIYKSLFAINIFKLPAITSKLNYI